MTGLRPQPQLAGTGNEIAVADWTGQAFERVYLELERSTLLRKS